MTKHIGFPLPSEMFAPPKKEKKVPAENARVNEYPQNFTSLNK